MSVLFAGPASARPDCDVADPPPICDRGTTDPPERIRALLTSAGLSAGRDVALSRPGAPVTVTVREGDAFRVKASASHSALASTVRLGGAVTTTCKDPGSDLGTSSVGDLVTKVATAGPGTTAAVQFDFRIIRMPQCTHRIALVATAEAAGQPRVVLPAVTFRYR